MEECGKLAEKAKDALDMVRLYLLSSSPDVGLHVGLKHIKGQSQVYILYLLPMMAAPKFLAFRNFFYGTSYFQKR